MRRDIKNPKLIIKNSVYLFIRLLLVMVMAFYTTRLTLHILGDEDYGINNIIGGVISIFAIISMPITGALQRFFNVEFTKQIIPRKVVFNTSLRIVLFMSIGILILYETIGLYFVNYVLKYPIDKTFAVNVIFQLAILTTICNFFSLAYSSFLVAKENMSIPATVEILVTFLKLGLIYFIPLVGLDVLIIYSIIIFVVSLIQIFFYMCYCWNNYEETHILNVKNYKLQREMLQFSSWSSINAIAGISLTYLSNIFINVFGGILYNTAYGISQQLSNAVVSFSTNVLKAVDPQITSSTIAGQDSYRNQVTLSTIKLCLLGVGLFYIFFMFYGNYLLSLWLNEVPDYVYPFCRVALFGVIVTSIGLPLRTIILATGKIKHFYLNYFYMAITANVLMFILLKMGYPIITVMYIILASNIGYLINAVVIVNKLTTLSYKIILLVIIKTIFVLIWGGLFTGMLRFLREVTFFNFIIALAACSLVVAILFYYVVLNKTERKYVGIIVNKFIKRV